MTKKNILLILHVATFATSNLISLMIMKIFKSVIILVLVALVCNANIYSQELSDEEILSRIIRFKPSNGMKIPKNIKDRLGATHVSGKYHLTNEAFIVEGAKQINRLGYGILKLWFDVEKDYAKGYIYNSSWNLEKNITPEKLAGHPYYKSCFDLPFTAISLCLNERFPGVSDIDSQSLQIVEKNMYDLTKYLLETYRERSVTFIIQNWEGDWLLRGGTGEASRWHLHGAPSNYPIRVKNMCDWITARQKGVNKARMEAGKSRCKVLHAVEANRVMDGMNGIPSIATHVLPEVEIDLVSWSAYDGIAQDGGIKLYRGIDFLRSRLRTTPYMKGEKTVMIGEIGYPENINNRTKEEVCKMWDSFMGVFLSQNIPYIFHWELYCNEPKTNESGNKPYPLKKAEELRGFWLIRPDGTESWAQQYLSSLLKQSGGKYKCNS
ncbi:MAG: hypothetical protein LBC40_04665, partial [Dysgonamonadaceae bacterium]|nr:hypothetical protein [Dysgonamonadaceae bacterium]